MAVRVWTALHHENVYILLQTNATRSTKCESKEAASEPFQENAIYPIDVCVFCAID